MQENKSNTQATQDQTKQSNVIPLPFGGETVATCRPKETSITFLAPETITIEQIRALMTHAARTIAYRSNLPGKTEIQELFGITDDKNTVVITDAMEKVESRGGRSSGLTWQDMVALAKLAGVTIKSSLQQAKETTITPEQAAALPALAGWDGKTVYAWARNNALERMKGASNAATL